MEKVSEKQAQAFNLATTTTPADESAMLPAATTIDVDGRAMIADLASATTAYCSMVIDTTEDKIKAYNAMSNADEQLSEHIGEEIPIRNVFVEAIECKNEQTGQPEICPRIVLIAADGKTFQAVSKGVFGSLKRIFQLFGTPDTWDFSLVVKAKSVKARNGYYAKVLEAVGVIPD